MKFDYCISNPAFNVAAAHNTAGTGGNTTLYKTATRNDFLHRLTPGGVLVNITLKGMISDLATGWFKHHQVNWIDLMDNIDVWPYNTCIFSVTKTARTCDPIIQGGLAAHIYTADPDLCFEFVYYSSGNNSMNKQFGPHMKHRVIRQLPGKGRDAVSYEYTDRPTAAGAKFAFYVLESGKSYTVTSEPIRGGTICYIPFANEQLANKFKLFVQVNPLYAEYTRRMKLRGHAFGVRNIRKFDVSQIVTGLETPREWLITDNMLLPPVVLPNDCTQQQARVKSVGEVFTPTALVERVLDMLVQQQASAFADPNHTFIDSMCGNGQFLYAILQRKLRSGSSVQQALSTIYGVDIMPDNVAQCKQRLLLGNEQYSHIVDNNIVCADALSYHYRFDNK